MEPCPKHPGSKVLYVRFRHGGRQYFRSTGETDPERAGRVAANIYAEVVSGRRILSTTAEGVEVLVRRPLRELFAEWLGSVEAELDETTFETYKLYSRVHYVPFFKTLDRLAAGTQDYVRARLRKVKSKTVRKELSGLRGAMAFFVERGYLSKAPVVSSPGKRATGTPDKRIAHKKGPVILEPVEIEAVISRLPERSHFSKRSNRAPVRARFHVAWETGLRPETLAALRASQDYKKGDHYLRIREEADKSRYAREVPLSEPAREALDSVCPKAGLIFGRHVFTAVLRTAARAAGLPEEKAGKLTAYDFRHSRATYWVENSQNLAGVAFLLGHKEITTLNRYVKPGQRAAERVLEAVSGEGPREASHTRGFLRTI